MYDWWCVFWCLFLLRLDDYKVKNSRPLYSWHRLTDEWWLQNYEIITKQPLSHLYFFTPRHGSPLIFSLLWRCSCLVSWQGMAHFLRPQTESERERKFRWNILNQTFVFTHFDPCPLSWREKSQKRQQHQTSHHQTLISPPGAKARAIAILLHRDRYLNATRILSNRKSIAKLSQAQNGVSVLPFDRFHTLGTPS